MLTKARTKFIRSLKLKKNRKEAGLFIVEGEKNVLEVLQSDYSLHSIYATDQFRRRYHQHIVSADAEYFTVSESQLKGLGTFITNKNALVLAKIKENRKLIALDTDIVIMLDNVRDPGNFGTILRICDWYGVKKIISSKTSADPYNPKVIASSMGSFARIQVFTTDLKKYMQSESGPFLGAAVDGISIHDAMVSPPAYIVFGNESHGIGEDLTPFLEDRLSIPKLGKAESLNVAVACAVILDNVARMRG